MVWMSLWVCQSSSGSSSVCLGAPSEMDKVIRKECQQKWWSKTRAVMVTWSVSIQRGRLLILFISRSFFGWNFMLINSIRLSGSWQDVYRTIYDCHAKPKFVCHRFWLPACLRTSPCSGCLPGSTSGCWGQSSSPSPSTSWSSMWSLCQWVSLRGRLDLQNTLITEMCLIRVNLSLPFSWSSRWPPCAGPSGSWCLKFHSQWSSWMRCWNIFPGITLKVCLEIHLNIQNETSWSYWWLSSAVFLSCLSKSA